MIFKTFEKNDIDKWTAKIGLFGKSFNDVIDSINKRKLDIDNLMSSGLVSSYSDAKNQVGGVFSYLHPNKKDIKSQLIDVNSVLPKIDENQAKSILQQISDIENGVNDEITSFQELYNTGNKQKQWIAKYAQETQGQIRSTDDLISANEKARASAIAHNNALKQQTLGAKAATIAMKGLTMVGNMLFMFAATKALELIVKAIDDYVHRLDNAKEALESTQSELESVNKEIDETTSKIKELESMDNLSITDKEDLEQLKLQNEELRIRQKYLEAQEQKDKEKVAKYTEQSYRNKYGESVDRSDIDKYKESYNTPKSQTASTYLTGGSNTTSTPYGAGQQSQEQEEGNRLAELIAKYEYYSDLKKKAIQDEDSEAIEKYNKKLESISDNLSENRTELQGFKDDIEASGEASPYLDEIKDKLKLIDDTLLSPGQNLVNFINSEELEGDKEKLVELANSGKLTQDELEKNFSNVNDYLKENGLTLEDLIGIIKIYQEELENVPNDTSILSTDELKEKLSDLNSAIDSIQSAYDTLNSAVEEYNSNSGQLSIDTLQSLMGLSSEYLACLQTENGQLSINQEAIAALANAKLDEAQALAIEQAMTELDTISKGENTSATADYVSGNAALMESLQILAGKYDNVASSAMTAAQAQALSSGISAASTVDPEATKATMVALDKKLEMISKARNQISSGNLAGLKKSSSSGTSSKSSKDELKEAFEAEYDLLKHNLEMEYITEEDYYNGVQDLNEKYFAGKEEYLDEYRKYEEEVYKGLKSYYKSYCDDMMDYYDKKLDASKMSYKEYCDSVSKMLADMHNSGKISDKDWYDYTKTMLEKQKDAYDRALSAITRRLQKEIDAWQAKIDVLNDQNDALNDQKDNYDKILSAVSNVYDKEIGRLNEQKDLLQDQIDALNDKNDALDLQYRKEQALYALQKAQQQRTRKLYVEGKGYIYDTDNEAIRDAQKDLDDITNEELINSLQKEQDKIQESIDILDKYKEKWNEIPDAWDKAVSEQLAIELWGQEYEKLILLNRTSDIENFKTKYLKIQSQINDNEELIKSYEEKVDYYNKLKDQWSSLTDEYSNSVDDMYAKMLLGQSWESDVLNGRLSTLNDFRNQYNDIQKSISDMAWQSANAQISALNAVKAAEATKAQTSGGSNGYSGSSGNVSSVSKPSQPKKDTVQHYWIYRTLGTFNTNGQASSKIGMLGGDGVISVGGKYLVVKWKKGYVTRGEASSNIVNYGGNGVYKRYASGTDNAKKGWNIVSEENPELIIRNNGEIDLAKGEQFYNFQGGEKVIPANETKEILKNQGNVEQLSDSDVITRKDGSILKPIHYEYENMLTNFIKDNPDYMYSMNTMSDNMCRDLFKNAENVNYDNRSVDNKVSIGEIHLHEVPNVDQFARELDRQLAGIVDQKLSRRKR